MIIHADSSDRPILHRIVGRAKTGFTLVELLVVVAVITMLTALLTAALAKAKEQGRRAKCASNLHQLSLALIMYTQENGGFIPSLAYNQPSGGSVVAPTANPPGGGNGGGNGGGGGGPYPNCIADANNMVYICHIPPGNPSGMSTEYVGMTATGPQGHQNHTGDFCGPCSGYIGPFYNGYLDTLVHGYLNAALGSGTGYHLASCPSDSSPEYVFVHDALGIPRSFPLSYNENLEFAFSRGRVDKLQKAANTILVFDGRPSDMVGQYLISKYNTQYASFRHLLRANAAYCDGHVESLPTILDQEILLTY